VTANSAIIPARRPLTPRIQLWAGILFWLLLAIWTWKLLEPKPVPDPLIKNLLWIWEWLPYLLAKCLHAFGYALLTFLACTATRGRGRWIAVVFLILHGAGTEIGQSFIPNRTGKPADVAIDIFGVLLGFWLNQRIWKR
jgi:VanZ family protein